MMNAEQFLAHYDQVADAPDAIDRLRRFILDLAVRGKLVPQDPDDEPVSSLIDRIAVEKAGLTKGALRRVKPSSSPVTIGEIPYVVPKSWRWLRLADLADFSPGKTPSRNESSFWNSGDYAWVSIADMVDGQTVRSTKESVSAKARGLIFKSGPEMPGTIIMSFKLTIGKISRLDIPAFHNEAIISIRPYVSDLDSYLFKVLPQFAKQGKSKGAIKGATLNRSSLSNILLPIPPLAEQHRIVAKVDEMMSLCDQLEAARTERETTRDKLTASALARLSEPDPESFRGDVAFALKNLPAITARPDQIKQLRQTILNLAVQGKLVPQDPNDEPALELLKRIAPKNAQLIESGQTTRYPEISEVEHSKYALDLPPGWSVIRLADISHRIHYGYTASADPLAKDVRMLRISDIQANTVDWGSVPGCTIDAQAVDNYRLGKGDILIARTGGTIGKSFLVKEVPVVSVFASYLIRIQIIEYIFDQYIKLFFDSTLYWDQLREGSRGTGQPNVNGRTLGDLVLPLAPLAEQHRIVAKVDELMALCDRLEASLEDTASTRQLLLDALLAEALEPAKTQLLEAAV